jgi:hypothetical protein
MQLVQNKYKANLSTNKILLLYLIYLYFNLCNSNILGNSNNKIQYILFNLKSALDTVSIEPDENRNI